MGRGQLVPAVSARPGWHRRPACPGSRCTGTDRNGTRLPAFKMGGTGFQPVVSGVPPEMWRALPAVCVPKPSPSFRNPNSELRIPNSALSSPLGQPPKYRFLPGAPPKNRLGFALDVGIGKFILLGQSGIGWLVQRAKVGDNGLSDFFVRRNGCRCRAVIAYECRFYSWIGILGA
jgi:hypothetical protein